MTTIQIRPTIPADLCDLAEVLFRVHASDGYPVEGVAAPQAWVELPDAIGQWTAVLDSQPVGHVALMRPEPEDGAPELLARRDGIPKKQIAVLSRLFVDPNARGNGIAQRLLNIAEEAAGAEGLALVLDVMSKDQSAIQLYEGRGWSLLGKIEHGHSAGSVEPGVAYALGGLRSTEALCATATQNPGRVE